MLLSSGASLINTGGMVSITAGSSGTESVASLVSLVGGQTASNTKTAGTTTRLGVHITLSAPVVAVPGVCAVVVQVVDGGFGAVC